MDLNQVTVPSRDVARSIAFYETLGLRLIVRALPHYARFECPEGTATFSVHRTEPTERATGTMIYFECARLDEWVATLTERGVAFDEPPSDRPWRWREARLRDPDGNRLVLYHAGADRKNPPWRC